MARLTFYGGVGQIGGNKILLEDGGSALFFDFGISFADRGRYYEEFLNPRPGVGLLDPLEMGLIPPLRGLYRQDLEVPGLWERIAGHPWYRELEGVDGVLLSHAHVDHSGHVSFLRRDIPIYATQMTAFIAKAMQDSSPTDFEKEVCYLSPREPDGKGYLAAARGRGFVQRPFVFLDGFLGTDEAQGFWDRSPARTKPMEVAPTFARPAKVGGLNLRFFPVDHSVFGAAAYAIETSAGWVVYTGDLRLHGGQAEKTRHFIEEVSALRPAVLLCEGTRMARDEEPGPRLTEEDVLANVLAVVREEPRLVVADFGPRNIERLLTLLAIARQTGRALVILAKDAYLLDAMRLASDQVPDLAAASDILIFDDLRARDEGWRQQVRERFAAKFVKPEAIHRSHGSYILCFSFWDINDLIDVRPQGGLYLYSSSEAFDEEQRMDLRRLRAWIDHFGMKVRGLPQAVPTPDGTEEWVLPEEEQGFHASGHASAADLVAMVKEINPKVLIPIHTENPRYFKEALRGTSIQVEEPERDGTIPLP